MTTKTTHRLYVVTDASNGARQLVRAYSKANAVALESRDLRAHAASADEALELAPGAVIEAGDDAGEQEAA